MRAKTNHPIRFVATLGALTGLALLGSSGAQADDTAYEQAKALNLDEVLSIQSVADQTSETSPTRDKAGSAAPARDSETTISTSELDQYKFERARLRRQRGKLFADMRAAMIAQGLPPEPNEIEQFDAVAYRLPHPELKVMFEARTAELPTAEPGSEQYFKTLRELALVGYLYAWNLANSDDMSAAMAAESVMDAAFAPHLADPPPYLMLPLARLYRLKSHIASVGDDKPESRRWIEKSLAMLDRLDVYPPDYVLMARLKARILLEDDQRPTGFDPEPCQLYDSLVALRPSDAGSLRGFVDCQISKGTDLAAKSELNAKRDGVAILDVTREYLGKAQGEYPEIAVEAGVLELQVLNALAKSERVPPFTVNADTYKYLAAVRFGEVLKGKLYIQNNATELTDIFAGFSDIDPDRVNLPRGQQMRDVTEVFALVADALEVSRTANPGSPSYPLIAAESRARAAAFRFDRGDLEGVDKLGAEAERVLDEAGFVRNLQRPDERAVSECLARNRLLQAAIARDVPDDAIASFSKLDATCGDWVRRYPWDLYVRYHVTDASSRLGTYLHDRGRTEEAIPYLTYASNWGLRDATSALASLYGKDGSALFDRAKASALRKLAEQQSLKRFTVPAQFDSGSADYFVYVWQYGKGPRCTPQAAPLDPTKVCFGYQGIEDQALWVSQLRGGTFTDKVMASFQKLYDIAEENSVSFPDLAVYALDEANKVAASEAQARTIYDQMIATGFARNPDRFLDPAGLALQGYDPVSYTQGNSPVLGDADFFALWDGALWLFKNAANRDRFNLDPARYAPQYGGFSAWEVRDRNTFDGKPTIFAIVEDKLLIFDNEAHIEDWKANAAALTKEADRGWADILPGRTDDPSPLSDMIAKLGKIAEAPRGQIYAEGCAAGKPELCQRQLVHQVEQCLDDNTIATCTVAIGFAERQDDKWRLVSVLGNRSWYYAQEGKADEAIADARRALAIDPDQPWIEGNLANGLLMKGDVAGAIAIYRAQQNRPGPGSKVVMCTFILDDVELLRSKGLASEEAAAQVRREIVCQ